MPNASHKKFFISIVLPSGIAVALFMVSLYAIFLPAFERAIIHGKKQMISELTNTVWSLVDEYRQEYDNGQLNLAQAQALAIERIAKIRYGDEQKDYFWIIDKAPRMIMHPYRPELINTDLNQYVDPNGKKLFVEATKVVKTSQQGFVDYMWQWKDNSTMVVPKLSFVKTYEPWGWIIGTGMYLDDVAAEITQLKRSLLQISLAITVFITIILLFVIRQSLLLEQKKTRLTSELLLSEQKYKTLVEASNQGLLMLVNEKIVFSNHAFSLLSGYSAASVSQKSLHQLLSLSWPQIASTLTDTENSMSVETELVHENGIATPVLAYIAKVEYSGEPGIIVSIKEITKKSQIARENKYLSEEIKASLQLMEQPIKHCVKEILPCPAELSIRHAAELLARKHEHCLFVMHEAKLLGIVTESDIVKRGLGNTAELDGPITQIMTAPIATIPEDSFLYEALLQFNNRKIQYLATTDNARSISGVISYRDITAMQLNTVSYYIQEIQVAERISELVAIHKKVPSLVLALIESGDNTSNITNIISAISDAFTKRIIDLGIEKLGTAPCKFAFIVMGSEGRMEQTLSTDQDNAIVFDDVPEAELQEVTEYFLKLGDYISYSLDEVGYNYCRGGIMACNEKWNKPFSMWKTYFDNWVNSSDLESIVDASIFFDFRGIYGDLTLTATLRDYVKDIVKQKPEFLHGMADSVRNYKSPVGTFGKIVGNDIHAKNNDVDIKMALMPVVKFARLYALNSGVKDTNTLARIRKLYENNVIPQKTFEALNLSYNYLMQMRFRVQAQALLNGDNPVNTIDTTALTDIEIATLKKIFAEVDAIPAKMSNDFS